MKKKLSNPLRPKRSKQVSSSKESAMSAPVLGSSAPSNSETVPESGSQIRHLNMSHQSQNLLKFLNEDRTRQRFCDVSVSVSGKLYNAHKVVLAHGSSYFHAELSKNPATARVTLDHVEDSVFQHLLGFLYTSECTVTETDLPALMEAARFLDMMDILKLLCKEGENDPVRVIQLQEEIRESPEVEMTPSDSPAAHTDIQSPAEAQCSICDRQFSTINSLQIHLAESHTDVQHESSTEKEKKIATTRRSTRRRRTPTKYQRNSPEEKQRTVSPVEQESETVEEAGKMVVEIQVSKPNVNATSKALQEVDRVDEEEGEGDMNEARRKGAMVCAADKRAGPQGPDVEGADREVMVHVPAAGSSTLTPVYPEGLAPVIIQTSSKKTLKCPKCDKTFDRAGENHRVRSRILL